MLLMLRSVCSRLYAKCSTKFVGEQARDGPVQFEKDTTNAADPFHIDEMIRDVTGGAGGSGGGNKKHGLQESEDRTSKRARVDNDAR